jgi:hypothetical protein
MSVFQNQIDFIEFSLSFTICSGGYEQLKKQNFLIRRKHQRKSTGAESTIKNGRCYMEFLEIKNFSTHSQSKSTFVQNVSHFSMNISK